MTVYHPEVQLHIDKVLQGVDEGDVVATPALFGQPPTNPDYEFLGRNQRFSIKDAPEGIDVQEIDDVNRTSIRKIREAASISYEFDMTDFSAVGNLLWLLGKGIATWNSKSFFASRNPAGTEYFKILNGCVPRTTTINFPENNEFVHVSGDIISTHPQKEGTTGPVIGTGSYASAITDPLVLPSEGGLDSFDYDSVVYKTKGMSITVEPLYNMVDADDNFEVQLMIPSGRYNISGTVNIFKKQGADAIQSDIFDRLSKAMRRVLKPFDSPTNGTRIDLTNVNFAEDDMDYSSIKTESTIKSYNFTATDIALTALTS